MFKLQVRLAKGRGVGCSLGNGRWVNCAEALQAIVEPEDLATIDLSRGHGRD
jgi:hypothetical protein